MSAPCNLWTIPAPERTSYSRWGQADPNLPQCLWAWRNIFINLIIRDHFSARRGRVLPQQVCGPRRALGPGLSQRRPEPESRDICLCRDTQLGAGDGGAGGDAQTGGAHPSPSADPAAPGLCSRRRDAGGRGSRREPVLPRHRLRSSRDCQGSEPSLGLGGSRRWLQPSAGVCLGSWLPLLLPGTRHGWGRIDSSLLSLTEHQLLRSWRKQGFLIKKKKRKKGKS